MCYSIILASASERRKKILIELGISPRVIVPEVNEILHYSDPIRTARENALLKSEWCRLRHPSCPHIAADTVIDFEGRCVTKPRSPADAADMFRRFSGKNQVIITGVALYLPGAPARCETVKSSVLFKKLDDSLITEYFSRVDPMDKAGGYDINNCTEMIIESFSGSWTNIMGLPKETVGPWLNEQLAHKTDRA